MGFDLFQTRRNFNEICRWWSRNESDDYEEDELIFKKKPSGMFCAKEINAETYDNNIINGMFMADRSTITIMSPDDLSSISKQSDMKNRVLVEYQGSIWRVDSVQKRKARIQNSEFASDRNVSHYWYLSLIRG